MRDSELIVELYEARRGSLSIESGGERQEWMRRFQQESARSG